MGEKKTHKKELRDKTESSVTLQVQGERQASIEPIPKKQEEDV